MSKYVESYWIEELPNGVIHLLINLTQREIYYHQPSENCYLIAGTQKEYDDFDGDCVLSIEDFLPHIGYGHYIPTSIHEKDQLSFYFIPHKREWIKTRKDRMLLDKKLK